MDRVQVAPEHWWITLHCPEIASEAMPGQFVQVRVPPDGYDPLLPRPMSICMADDEKLVLLIQVLGEGTRRICQQPVDGDLALLGPLGRGFTMPRGPARVALIAGGVGVAPLIFAAQHMPSESDWVAFIGARTATLLVGADDLPDMVPVHVATDDGSKGFQGTVVDLFRKTAVGAGLKPAPPFDLALVCGPPGMMRAAKQACQDLGVPCQVSVEALMACGFGVCLGCAVPTPHGGYVRACMEGPCFSAEEIALG